MPGRHERAAGTAVLLANVGHELRTPLNAILGSGRVLQDTTLAPAQREMTRKVVSAGQRLLTLANDISAASGAGSPGSRQPGPGSDADRA